MRRLTFENIRGEKIVFYLSPYLIEKLEGIGEIEANLQSQKAPFQDGDTHIDTTLEPRFINLEGSIMDTDFEAIRKRRRQISRICNPKLGLGLITLELDGDLKQIRGTLDGGVAFPEREQDPWQSFAITWKCPNPYWLDEEHVSQLVVWEGGLEFPLQLPTEFAIQSNDKARILTNEGDAETPVHVTFMGPATSPIKIVNKSTGDFIEVNQSLEANERLEINTTFGQKKVVKVAADGTETNAFHFITLGSTFLQLQMGNNLIDYSTGADYERAAVTIAWHNRYVGV